MCSGSQSAPGRLDGVWWRQSAIYRRCFFKNDPVAWVGMHLWLWYALMPMILPKACLTLAALAGVWKAFRLGESENTLGFLMFLMVSYHPKDVKRIQKSTFRWRFPGEVSKILLGTDASKASRPREANSMCCKMCYRFNQICMYEQPWTIDNRLRDISTFPIWHFCYLLTRIMGRTLA